MLIKTVLELGIDIDDPIGKCDDNHIKYTLETKYQGKCFRECYIKSIDRIIKRGEIIINQMSATGFGTLPIIVEATAVVFLRGEVITGCHIKHINERAKLITCETDHAFVMLRGDKAFSSLQVGQYINVQVGLTQYTIGMNKAVINGAAYLPGGAASIYKITDTTLPTQQLMKDVMGRIEYEEGEVAQIKSSNEKSWTIFSSLVYAYSAPQKIESTLNIQRDQEKMRDYKYLTRDVRIEPTTPFVLATNEDPGDLKNVVEVTLQEAIIALLEDYAANLRIVREMISVYSTPELIKAHANLWGIYRSNKLA